MGRPFEGVNVQVFGDNGEPCASGESGRIGISTPSACIEYVDDPESSARTFKHGYVFPGDRGYLDAQGWIHVLGRDDIINIGGDKVDGTEVEEVIRESLPVTEVVALAGELQGLPVVCVVIEADPDLVTRSMVKAVCREQLARHKRPRIIEIRSKLMRDANGKILRTALEHAVVAENARSFS